MKEAPSTTPMQALLSSAVDTRLHQPAFGAMLESVPARQREAFRASAQRQLVDAAVFQSVQRQADDWLAEQRYHADSVPPPDAAAKLSEQLRAAASPLRSWRPEYVPMVEAAQQRAMMQAQRRLAEEQATAAHGNDTKSAAVEEQRRVAERADAELAALQRCPSCSS
eukprot:SAG25_NODE_815_length_5228_cov_19.727042_3_plen_167_part_00